MMFSTRGQQHSVLCVVLFCSPHLRGHILPAFRAVKDPLLSLTARLSSITTSDFTTMPTPDIVKMKIKRRSSAGERASSAGSPISNAQEQEARETNDTSSVSKDRSQPSIMQASNSWARLPSGPKFRMTTRGEERNKTLKSSANDDTMPQERDSGTSSAGSKGQASESKSNKQVSSGGRESS